MSIRTADFNQYDITRRSGQPLYVWLFLAGLVANMFSGHTLEMGIPVPVDRGLLALAILLLVLDQNRERLRWRAFYAVAAATIFWTALSWVSSAELADSAKLFALVDRIIIPLAMFPIGALIFATATRREWLLRIGALLGCYLGFVGLFEYLGVDSLVFPSYIAAAHDLSEIVELRSGGPWASPEPFGMAAALTLFMPVLLLRTTAHLGWRILAVLGGLGGLLGSILCMTRSVWSAVIVAGLVVGLMLPRTRRRLPLFILIAVGIGAALLALFPELADGMFARLTTERSVYDRQNTNNAAWRIITQLPVFGIGWGEFINQNVDWVRQADTYPVTTVTIEVHNVLLARAAETGVLGAVLWILCFATGPLLGLSAKPQQPWARQWKLLGVAAFFVWLFPTLLSPNPYPMPNYLIWLIWGVASRGILVDLPARPEARGEAGARRPEPALS